MAKLNEVLVRCKGCGCFFYVPMGRDYVDRHCDLCEAASVRNGQGDVYRPRKETKGRWDGRF